jgi:primosomal replication protein N
MKQRGRHLRLPPRLRNPQRSSGALQANTVTLSGIITAIEPLRHTPAGLPLMRFQLKHSSTQIEAGMQRQVECEAGCVGIGDIATALSKFTTGAALQVSGFLAKKGRNGTQIILHVSHIANITNEHSVTNIKG